MARQKRGNGKGTLFKRPSRKPWYASYFGADGKRRTRSTGTTVKSDAERIMQKWIERAALEREGLVKPEGGTGLERHGAASIASHLDTFTDTKKAEGRTERHIDETRKMIEVVAEARGWSVLSDMSAEDLEQHLAYMRAPTAKKKNEKPPKA